MQHKEKPGALACATGVIQKSNTFRITANGNFYKGGFSTTSVTNLRRQTLTKRLCLSSEQIN